jgi:hypothetical protein
MVPVPGEVLSDESCRSIATIQPAVGQLPWIGLGVPVIGRTRGAFVERMMMMVGTDA